MSENEPRKPVRVAAVGDLHVHDKPAGTCRSFFENVSRNADILALCGDLTTMGLPTEAENLAADLAQCTIPVVAVLGNHDHETGHVEEIKKILQSVRVNFLGDEPYVHQDVGFAGVKGFGGGFGRHMLTSFGEEGIKKFVSEALQESLRLENSLRSLNTPKTVVILHYSPIPATLVGEPTEIYPFLGSSRLAETIDNFDVSVVFHGHAHHGSYEGHTNRGVPVYNAALDLMRSRNPEQPYALIEM